MQDFDRVNSSDIDSDSGETDENMDAEKIVKNMKTKRKRAVNLLVRSVGAPIQKSYMSAGIGKPSFVHALIVIFLEFFAWGLLTDRVINVLNDTFPDSTFLANGLIQGLKGILSFLSAPLIGAMTDIYGRKVFLLITVFFTCLPIPLIAINPMWYFAMISISGLFAVTFSVVFAYVADVTDETNRTTAYGLVSATFAASLITSPAIGSYLTRYYSENLVVTLATAIALFDMLFILVAVPESLPDQVREHNKTISWENVDPFKSLKSIWSDRTIALLCVTVFLSYIPEAGQFSCFFVYLKLVIGFSQAQVAYYIAYVGILSCFAQAAILVLIIKYFGSKKSIIIGLSFQVCQLTLFGFASQSWLIWFSGFLAAMSSIGYPAISAYISNQSHADQQGISQGLITGIRGLCNGIGPALYGFVFWIFGVKLSEPTTHQTNVHSNTNSSNHLITYAGTHLIPGPPFLFGAVLALLAIFVTCLISENKYKQLSLNSPRNNKEKETGSIDTSVKIVKNTSTYNRTRTNSASMQNADLLSSNNISLTPDLEETNENQNLLIEANYTNIISPSSNSSISPAVRSTFSSSQLIPNVNQDSHYHAQNSLNNHLSSIFYSNSNGLYGKLNNEGINSTHGYISEASKTVQSTYENALKYSTKINLD